MRSFQKIVKYCSMALAISIAACIFGSVFMVIAVIGNLFDKHEVNVDTNDLKVVDIKEKNYSGLDIELISSSLMIKESDQFRIETNNEYVNVVFDDNSLEIDEREHLLNNTTNLVIIYVPYNYEFIDVSIDSGAGSIEIDKLATKKINLDLGAGIVKINNLFVLGEADIDGGAGAIEINNGNINNLDLDLGVGKFVMKTKLIGNSFINAGIGDSKITLIGVMDDYNVKINKGIGDAIVDDKVVSNNTTHGNGPVKVNIDGGMGSIVVKYLDSGAV